MRNLLESFFREGDMRVDRTGTCHGFQYEIEWLNSGGDKPDVKVSNTQGKGLIMAGINQMWG